MSFSLLTSLLLSSTLCNAALLSSEKSATFFYRSPQSSFPSGQAPLKSLEAQKLSEEAELWFEVSQDGLKHPIKEKAQNFITDWEVSSRPRTKGTIQLLKAPLLQSESLQTLAAQSSLELLSSHGYWLKVRAGQQVGYLPWHSISLAYEDQGVFINLIDSFLKAAPHDKSELVTTIPKSTRLPLIEISGAWLKTSYLGTTGYVRLDQLVGRADFASLVFVDNQWRPVRYRQNEWILTQDNKKFHLKDISGYVTHHQKVIATGAGQLSLNTRPQLIKMNHEKWALSRLKDHGLIWWKKSYDEEPLKITLMTTEELLKRRVSSFSTKGSVALASAEGIFYTTNGETWQKLEQFEDKDYPVHLHNENTWVVGPFMSRNGGADFAPFIRWEKLADSLRVNMIDKSKTLKLSRIESYSPFELKLTLNNGLQKIQMKGLIGGHDWKMLR